MLDSKGDSCDGSKDSDDREKNGKNGFDGNTPELVIFQLSSLGFLESGELMDREIIAVIFGTSIDGDVFGNNIVSYTDHGLLTNRTNNGGVGGVGVGRSN